MGRLETVLLETGSAALLWMEMGQGENIAGIYVRTMTQDGVLSPAALIIESSQARASGFPRAAVRGTDKLLLSYTEAGKTNQVKVLEVTLSQLIESRSIESAPTTQRLSSVRPTPEFCSASREDVGLSLQ